MSTVCVETVSATQQEPKEQQQEKVAFRLPDGKTELHIETTVTGPSVAYEVHHAGNIMSRWVTDGTTARVSPAMVNEDVAAYDNLLRFETANTNASSIAFGDAANENELTLLWTSVYALWLHPQWREKDQLAIVVNNKRLASYLRCTGLGMISPFSPEKSTTTEVPSNAILWIPRESFWQAAGAPESQSWLRSRPEISEFPGFNGTNGTFPSQLGFTRQGNVCSVHPVRPPKPAPGTLLYSRYIVELGEQLRIYHIDASNPVHFRSYANWQNSDRVNTGWNERGPDEHHRNYLESQLADPHTMSCVFEWDGELAGYTEIGFAMEDNASCFIGSNCNITVGEHDQNTHFLVGEEKFRGGKRYQAAYGSIKHLAFLRDPRTKQIIGEPRYDQANIHIQSRFIPLEKKKRFHLPHKTSMLISLQRDRFFQEGHFL